MYFIVNFELRSPIPHLSIIIHGFLGSGLPLYTARFVSQLVSLDFKKNVDDFYSVVF